MLFLTGLLSFHSSGVQVQYTPPFTGNTYFAKKTRMRSIFIQGCPRGVHKGQKFVHKI